MPLSSRAFGAIEQRGRRWGRDAIAVHRPVVAGPGGGFRARWPGVRRRTAGGGKIPVSAMPGRAQRCFGGPMPHLAPPGTPFLKTLDLTQLIHQAISKGVPQPLRCPASASTPGTDAAAGPSPYRPVRRRRDPRPPPPAPLLNGAEGARRKPHPTEPSSPAPSPIGRPESRCRSHER
ncbi:hypothetical protein SMALA_2474 [Streptomyces malaysiensis subsp. malaysiensis]|nr:hypothetical protein SMALA_2474 [Streptomyces malaysiensis]